MDTKKEPSLRYVLTMTKEQAIVAERACELYCRLIDGQLDELNHDLLLRETRENICERREEAMDLLLQLKKIYFPELRGHGHSYGLGHNIVADRSWVVYQAIRFCRAWQDNPDGGIGCHFDPPFAPNTEPIPQCVVSHINERNIADE